MSMTLGKDVSSLFPDVLKNIATADLDQKKLVYLYLMYAPFIIVVILVRVERMLIRRAGTTPSRIQTFVFSPSTPSYKTPKIRIRWFARSQYAQWAASA